MKTDFKNMKAAMHNLGCKVNSYEAEAMVSELRDAGVEIVSWEKDVADIYIINTCSVTNIADRKSRQMIHKARAMNPDAIVIAVGCYVQARSEELKQDTAVDILVGNNDKSHIIPILEEYLSENYVDIGIGENAEKTAGIHHTDENAAETCVEEDLVKTLAEGVCSGSTPAGIKSTTGVYADEVSQKAVYTEKVSGEKVSSGKTSSGFARNFKSRTSAHVRDINKEKSFEELRAGEITDNGRVFIKVQDGCNQFCSYCIIPYVRGRIRSRSLENTISEVEDFARRGYHEVVLTGIHLSSYGLDFDNANYEYAMDNDIPSERLLELIRKTAEVQGVTRVRLGSLEPRIITEAFADELKKIPEVCPHFHLSLQSGCDRTLKAMNRHYDTEAFRKSVEIIRKRWADAAVTTDVIVGFPGETEEDFRDSYRFIDEIGFYELHVFKYSRRQGTAADKMKDQVTDRIKAERSEKLIRLDGEKSDAFRRKFIGRPDEIIPEEIVTIDGKKYLRGYNRSYVRYVVPVQENLADEGKIGQIMRVQGTEFCETCVLAMTI